MEKEFVRILEEFISVYVTHTYKGEEAPAQEWYIERLKTLYKKQVKHYFDFVEFLSMFVSASEINFNIENSRIIFNLKYDSQKDAASPYNSQNVEMAYKLLDLAKQSINLDKADYDESDYE